jgi:hypothetical protein
MLTLAQFLRASSDTRDRVTANSALTNQGESDMATNRRKAAAPAAGRIAKQLGELAGKEIRASEEHLIHLIFPIASTTVEPGQVTFERIFFPGKSCSPRDLLDVAGTSSTGADGKRVFLLSEFLCSTINNFAAPVNLVATPRSANPGYATATSTLVPNPALPGAFSDVQITIFTWAPNGAPGPNVAVDWRCRVVQIPIIL